jgi:hypothetical protein
MALPVLENVWQHNVNQLAGGAGTDEGRVDDLLLKLVNALLGFPSGTWTVWGSSNGVTAENNTGVNLWTSEAALKHASAGADHSWIVLKNPTLGVQICFDLANASTIYWAYVVSVAGFNSDGTKTTRPTAADVLNFSSDPCFVAGGTWRLHVMHTTNGLRTRVILCYSNGAVVYFFVEKAEDRAVIPGWSGIVCGLKGVNSTASQTTFATFCNGASTYTRIGAVNAPLYMTCEGYANNNAGTLLTMPDDNTGEYYFFPIGLANHTGTNRGRIGRLSDMWWGSTTPAIGSTYPADASRQFAQFGHMIFPWNGTAPLTA